MNGYKKYQRVNISTADPLRLVVMLYEGGIQFLNQALRLMGEDDAGASSKIGRTLDIIHYLRNSLDFEKGGEVSVNLERMYEYMQHRLTQANIHREKAPIEEVITLLHTLLEGWRGLVGSQTADQEADGPPSQRISAMVG